MAYTINLKHRGPSVVSQIDLFDECHFGADKLFLRGDFGDFEGVKEQIKIALGGGSLDDAKLKEMYGVEINDDFKAHKLGIGNPLINETSEEGGVTVPTIALNRYYIPNKKFWNNVVPTDVENPYKASAAVKFSLRLYFRDDYAYITFGCPWEFTSEYGNGTLDKSSSDEEFTNKFVLFDCHFISKEDALKVLDTMFGNVSENTAELALMRVLPQYDIITTDIVDEEGNILS